MNNEELNAYANRIEATGPKRDTKVTDLHHYAVAVEVTPKTYGEDVDAIENWLEVLRIQGLVRKKIVQEKGLQLHPVFLY